MVHAKLTFIVGPDGRRRGVFLPMAHYRRMVRKIEDLEDALTLDRAEKSSHKLLPYSLVRRRLQRAGKL
jgi:hypothetical protein